MEKQLAVNKGGRPVSHGMGAYMEKGDIALSKQQRDKKAYLSELIRGSEGRAEIMHEVCTVLSLIVLEASAFLLAQDQPGKSLNQLLNSNMRLLGQFMANYPEDKPADAPAIDAMKRAGEALEQQENWSIDK